MLRAELRKIRAERFDGNLSAMARDLKVTPAYLSDALSEKRGIGMKLIRALARFTGRTIDDLVGAPTVATVGRWNALLFSTGAAGLGAWVAIGNAPHGGYLIALVIVALVISRRIAAEADQWLRIADDVRRLIEELRAAIRALPLSAADAAPLTGVRAAGEPSREGTVAEEEETAQTRERRERTP